MRQDYRPWLKRELDTLATMRRRGASFEEIGVALVRTPKACKAIASLHGNLSVFDRPAQVLR